MTLAEYLAEYAADVVQEWMRIIYLQDGDTQARMNWENDGRAFTLGESQYSAEYGRFRLIVRVEPLPPLPPIGPENDGAMQAELSTAGRYIEGLHCQECCPDDEDPRAWCDCLGDDPPCKAPCRQRAHAPDQCPNRQPSGMVLSIAKDGSNAVAVGNAALMSDVANELARRAAIDAAAGVETWEEATFLLIEPGDDIRIPGTTDTADVISVSRSLMRVNVKSRLMPSGRWWDEIVGPWDHFEMYASLAVNGGEPTGLVQYPSDTAVEILCTPERKAQLILARAFIGTAKIGEK